VENLILSIRTDVAKFYLAKNMMKIFHTILKTTTRDYHSSDWSKVCRNWEKTYKISQEDVKSLSYLEFMQDWPKLGHSKLSSLVILHTYVYLIVCLVRFLSGDCLFYCFLFKTPLMTLDHRIYRI